MKRPGLLKQTVSKVKSWHPPVFKGLSGGSGTVSYTASSVAVRVLTSAVSFAVAAITMDIVQEDLIRTTNTERSVRRLVAFMAAFLAGAITYLIMWFFFGAS